MQQSRDGFRGGSMMHQQPPVQPPSAMRSRGDSPMMSKDLEQRSGPGLLGMNQRGRSPSMPPRDQDQQPPLKRDQSPMISFGDRGRSESPMSNSILANNSKKDFVKEWNKGVRGQVSDTPRSPGPVQEDLEESPESPKPDDKGMNDLDTPESPPTVMETPMSPVADTPASPMDDTPASPDNDTPASPECEKNRLNQSDAKKEASDSTSSNNKPDPKVIPLERQFLKKKIAEFDIRSPKDWHRGLRATSATSSASPSSECSDDSEKGPKKLQIVESPTSSSPASPASGGEAAIARPPTVLPLPTPIPSTGPTPAPIPKVGLPLPLPQPPASSPTATTTLQLHGHPSRPSRPTLSQTPIEQPKWKSQPRLAHPPPPSSDFRGPVSQRPPFRPHPAHHPHHLQPRPPLQAKKPLTYGEYRRLKEEAERRHNPQHQMQPQQPHAPQPVVMNRRDPRRPPKQVCPIIFKNM